MALRWWARRQVRAQVMSLPVGPEAYALLDAASVAAAAIQEALATAATELAPWGFELLGYLQLPEFDPSMPRIEAVFRDPTSRAFAIVGFARSAAVGAIVNFETLF